MGPHSCVREGQQGGAEERTCLSPGQNQTWDSQISGQIQTAKPSKIPGERAACDSGKTNLDHRDNFTLDYIHIDLSPTVWGVM